MDEKREENEALGKAAEVEVPGCCPPVRPRKGRRGSALNRIWETGLTDRNSRNE